MSESTTLSKGEDATSGLPKAHEGRKPPFKLLLILAIAGIIFAVWWFFLKPAPEDDSRLFVSGRIEGYETDVGAKIGGRIESLRFREGEEVKKGDQVAKLTDDDIQARLRQAKAKTRATEAIVRQRKEALDVLKWQIQEASLEVSQSKEDVSARIDQTEAQVAQAGAQLEEAKARLVEAKSSQELAGKRKERFEKLIKPGAVTKDEYDAAITNYETSTASVKSREASVAAANRNLTAAKAQANQAKADRFRPGMRTSRVSALKQQYDEAVHQLESAKEEVSASKAQEEEILADIAYLDIASPITGVVTARPVEPGAVVAPGAVLISLIDLDDLYMRGFVPEAEIGRVRVGQKAKVYLDSFPEHPFDSTVIAVDPVASFTPENIYFKDDRVKQVFGIKIKIANPDRQAKPGMPADAWILTDDTVDFQKSDTGKQK